MPAPGQRRHAQVDRGWTGPRPPVSVVVLTLNEEINIAECLDSCAWSDDVHVLDSGSEDRTRERAEAGGAKVHVHPFESFGKQRNWAIDNIPLKHDWVFHLDADERFTPELVHEIDRVLATNPRDAGFLVPNKMILMGKWLRRAGGYPTFQVRLFHKARMRFTDYGHGQREETGGRIGRIETPYLHYSFSKGLYDWFEKHNRYSSLEAVQFLAAMESRPALSDLLGRDALERRRAWKRVCYGLPFWARIRWFATLFIAGGVLEGKAGFTYARLLAMYEHMIQMKLRLIRAAREAGTPDFEADRAQPVSTRITDPTGRIDRGAGMSPTRDAPSVDSGRNVAHPQPIAPGAEPQPLAAGTAGRGETPILPEPSPWTFREKAGRALWMLVGGPLFRLSFHNWYGYRRGVLRLFGAKIGRGVRIRPTAHVEVPWLLELGEGAIVGDHAILYDLGRIQIGERAVISQYAHLCAGTHDHTDRTFPLIRDPIVIGPGAWIATDAFVGPNVRVGALAVLGARSSAYKDLEPATIYAGNPAKPIRKRVLREDGGGQKPVARSHEPELGVTHSAKQDSGHETQDFEPTTPHR